MVVTAATVVVTGVIVEVIEDIGASAPTDIAMAIVRIVDMAQLVRPWGMAAAGLIHTTNSYSGVCRPSGGYYGARGVYGARVYRGRGYAYRGYRGGYRGGVYRGRAVAVRGGYGRGFARGRR